MRMLSVVMITILSVLTVLCMLIGLINLHVILRIRREFQSPRQDTDKGGKGTCRTKS